MIKNLHRWTRLSSVKWEDAWEERLRFLGPERVIYLTWPESRALKIQAFCDAATAARLVKRFGGKSTKVPAHFSTGDPERPRGPLAIRGKLKVFSDELSWQEWKDTDKKPPGILIPAGMAFGTGEHATTATCLRFLADLAPELPKDFSLLDLGTGSGILAIAAEVLGAGRVEANDFDPIAVKIAKQNARKNKCRRTEITVGDALKIKDRNRHEVVAANLFSELLMGCAPRIARALKPRGWLVFSGVLRKQADEVAARFVAEGFEPPRIISRGKWCAGLTRKVR